MAGATTEASGPYLASDKVRFGASLPRDGDYDTDGSTHPEMAALLIATCGRNARQSGGAGIGAIVVLLDA